MVALEGQHKELVTKELSKVVPSSIKARTLGMCLSVFGFRSLAARSSARTRTTFGGLGPCRSSFFVSFTAGKQPASPRQATSKKTKGPRTARAFPDGVADPPVSPESAGSRGVAGTNAV